MPKKKELKHTKKGCGGTFQTEYNDHNVPFLVCDNCGHRIEDWLKWETEYKYFWQDDDKWESKKDHLTCLLGWFAHLYEEYYGTGFTFSLNEKGLFRGTEMHHIRKMYSMFGNNAMPARDYISWIFQNKVRLRKKRITSLGFLATPAVIQEFKLMRERQRVVSRSTPLPEKMSLWVEKFAPEVLDYVSLRDFGELNLMLTYYKDGHLQGEKAVDAFVKKLIKTGYIDSGLNIRNWRE